MKRTVLLACVFAVVFAAAARGEEKFSLRRLYSDPAGYSGKTVTHIGGFRGWVNRCAGLQPVSKQDWVFVDLTGCTWVTGPMPAGIDPKQAKGEPIRLTGVVKLTKSGKAYIEAKEVSLIPIPPKQ